MHAKYETLGRLGSTARKEVVGWTHQLILLSKISLLRDQLREIIHRHPDPGRIWQYSGISLIHLASFLLVLGIITFGLRDNVP